MGAKLTINNIFLVIDYIQQHNWLTEMWLACLQGQGGEQGKVLGGIATSLKAGPHWFHFMPRVCLEWVIHPSVHDMPQIERYHIINFFEGRDDMTYNVKLKQKCSRINQTCDKAPFGAIFEHNARLMYTTRTVCPIYMRKLQFLRTKNNFFKPNL